MNHKVLSRRALAGVALTALALAGCGGNADSSGSGNTETNASGSEYSNLSGELKASGASFPGAYYQKALDEFANIAPRAQYNV